MERHLLLTVSERHDGLFGVRFAGRFFSGTKDVKFTVLYLTPKSQGAFESDHDSELHARKWEAKGRQALQTAKGELLKAGFKEDQLATKLQSRRISKVKDIIQEGAVGQYDAVVLGRRGLSWLEQVYDESVTKEMLQQTVDFPLWICRLPDLNRKNVLACVDGSDASHRMLDHVGFILEPEEHHTVTLMTVAKKGKIADRAPEEVFSKSRAVLTGSGISAERIYTKVVDEASPSKAILKAATEGAFAAIAVGRTGAGKGRLKKMFVGSVSDALFQNLQGASLWLA
ncbi:MAG: universal stress protein [Deltaproteobacteria bacterium]|nr:universal stress protein [Deltaproteobacteria bacterium]